MVEWKKLGEVCETITPPKKLTKENYLEKGLYPIIDQGQSNVVGYTDDESTLLENNEYVLFGDHTRYVKYFKGNFAQGADGLKILRAKKSINTKYFYYTFQNTEVPSRGYSRHWSIAKDILIPIPSLEEQERIVGILDTFTASIDNIKAQIEQRRKQYEHYRNTLLTFNKDDDSVEWKTLEDIFELRNGYTPSKANSEFWTDGTIPWFRMEDIRDKGRILSDSYLHITESAIKGKGLFKANSFILATTATIGEHALLIADSLANQQFTNLKIRKSLINNIDIKFMFYYMFVVDEFCKSHTNVSGFASVDMNALKRMAIPIPTLARQQEIVSILDTFEASITNLEAQLEQRQKQYEYYREELLTNLS